MKYKPHIAAHHKIGELRVKEAAYRAVVSFEFPVLTLLSSRNRTYKRYNYLYQLKNQK